MATITGDLELGKNKLKKELEALLLPVMRIVIPGSEQADVYFSEKIDEALINPRISELFKLLSQCLTTLEFDKFREDLCQPFGVLTQAALKTRFDLIQLKTLDVSNGSDKKNQSEQAAVFARSRKGSEASTGSFELVPENLLVSQNLGSSPLFASLPTEPSPGIMTSLGTLTTQLSTQLLGSISMSSSNNPSSQAGGDSLKKVERRLSTTSVSSAMSEGVLVEAGSQSGSPTGLPLSQSRRSSVSDWDVVSNTSKPGSQTGSPTTKFSVPPGLIDIVGKGSLVLGSKFQSEVPGVQDQPSSSIPLASSDTKETKETKELYESTSLHTGQVGNGSRQGSQAESPNLSDEEEMSDDSEPSKSEMPPAKTSTIQDPRSDIPSALRVPSSGTRRKSVHFGPIPPILPRSTARSTARSTGSSPVLVSSSLQTALNRGLSQPVLQTGTELESKLGAEIGSQLGLPGTIKPQSRRNSVFSNISGFSDDNIPNEHSPKEGGDSSPHQPPSPEPIGLSLDSSLTILSLAASGLSNPQVVTLVGGGASGLVVAEGSPHGSDGFVEVSADPKEGGGSQASSRHESPVLVPLTVPDEWTLQAEELSSGLSTKRSITDQKILHESESLQTDGEFSSSSRKRSTSQANSERSGSPFVEISPPRSRRPSNIYVNSDGILVQKPDSTTGSPTAEKKETEEQGLMPEAGIGSQSRRSSVGSNISGYVHISEGRSPKDESPHQPPSPPGLGEVPVVMSPPSSLTALNLVASELSEPQVVTLVEGADELEVGGSPHGSDDYVDVSAVDPRGSQASSINNSPVLVPHSLTLDNLEEQKTLSEGYQLTRELEGDGPGLRSRSRTDSVRSGSPFIMVGPGVRVRSQSQASNQSDGSFVGVELLHQPPRRGSTASQRSDYGSDLVHVSRDHSPTLTTRPLASTSEPLTQEPPAPDTKTRFEQLQREEARVRAESSFNQHRFALIRDVRTRLQTIQGIQQSVSSLGVQDEEAVQYQRLLSQAQREAETAISIAKKRFEECSFISEQNMQLRQSALLDAQSNVVRLRLTDDQRQVYTALLSEELGTITASIEQEQRQQDQKHQHEQKSQHDQALAAQFQAEELASAFIEQQQNQVLAARFQVAVEALISGIPEQPQLPPVLETMLTAYPSARAEANAIEKMHQLKGKLEPPQVHRLASLYGC